MSTAAFIALTALLLSSFFLGRAKARAFALASGSRSLHSHPTYHGYYLLLWVLVPTVLIFLVWRIAAPQIIRSSVLQQLTADEAMNSQTKSMLMTEIENTARGAYGLSRGRPEIEEAAERLSQSRQSSSRILATLLLLCAAAGGLIGWTRIHPQRTARCAVERSLLFFLLCCSTIAVLTTFGIVASLLFESARFFSYVTPYEFLFGLKWSPQIAIRADQVGSSGAFGAVPLFVGTALIAGIAMCVALPVGLFAAIYLSEYAGPAVRRAVKPILEILAGVPTVVYGFFAALTVAPFVHDLAQKIGLSASSESAIAAGGVMGVMIIPFISSLSDDVINAVPQALRDGSYALGATQSETIKKVVIPAALPGIVGAALLAVSRAVGETMIVVMAAGLSANLTLNPFANVTTVTVQIVTTLVGDQEFDSPKTLSAFALGLVLFFFTLMLNIVALQVVKRFRERYE